MFAGRVIVVTRPAVGPLDERLAALGAIVQHVPLIEITDPADGGAALQEALDELERFDWLVVTSANGAERVGAAARDAPGVRLATVGPATAAALRELAGRPVDLVPTVATAEGLAAAFPAGRSRVLLAQADLANDRLATALRDRGHIVTIVEAYATRRRAPDHDDLDVLRGADAVVLASGSAVEAWRAAEVAAGSPWATVRARVVTIGPKTAAVAEALGLPVAAVAETPTDDGVIDALARALTTPDV